MVTVKISYYGLIKNVVDKAEDENYLSGDATVKELLHSLVQKYGDGFRSMVLTSDWELHPIAIIYLNGRDINEIEGLNSKLEDNSELSITVMPYEVYGG